MKRLIAITALLATVGCATAKPEPQTTQEIFDAGIKAAWKTPRTSEKIFQRGLALARQQGNQEKVALFLVNLGGIAASFGDYPKALDLYTQSLAIQRTLPHHEEVEARILRTFGLTYEDLGDYSKAIQFLSDSISITRHINESWDESTFLGELGRVYGKLGDPAKALELHQKGLEVAVRLKDKERQGIAWDHIGEARADLGQLDKALEAFNSALALSKENGNFPSSNMIELHMSDVYLAQGNLEAAGIILKRVRFNVSLGYQYLLSHELGQAEDMFSNAVRGGKALRRAGLLLSGYLGLAMTLEQRGDAESARSVYAQAIAETERERELLPLSARGAFLSGKVFGAVLRLEAYQGRARVSEDPATGFFWAENTKARVFVESLSERFRKSATELPPNLARTEAEVTARVLSVTKERDQAFERNQMTRYDELAPEFTAARQQQAKLVETLRHDYPKYAALVYPQPVKAEAVALKATEILIEFEVTSSKTLLFILRTGQPVVRLDIPVQRTELEELVGRFRHPFENPVDDDGRFQGAFDAESGTALYKALLQPAIDKGYVTKGSEIIIVPDEALGLLPFEALNAGPEKHYLGDDYDISYAQSATAFTLARNFAATKTDTKGVFILADPVFDRTDARLGKNPGPKMLVRAREKEIQQAQVAQIAQAAQAVARRMGADEDAGFARLVDTGALASETVKLFGKDATALVGLHASKEELHKADLSRYRFLIFATHGILDNDVPYIREPSLVLTQVNRRGSTIDGFLKMSEVMDLKLDAEVVALTACKTGLGRAVGGEGVVGLGRAFQYAGARNVLVSLWSVAEKSTTLLAQAVLERLKAGDTPRQALKKARLRLRAQGYDHPFFWAPFVLMGS
ncbi:MAG: CHAT domain-containing protein [Deltaproteobacteria bacterium]|nr:CHAT domain-containing protein [Deltaproteobacteria bacterium]